MKMLQEYNPNNNKAKQKKVLFFPAPLAEFISTSKNM